jgi:hypothetical protein
MFAAFLGNNNFNIYKVGGNLQVVNFIFMQ